MVRRSNVVLDRQNLAYVDEEHRREAASVFCYEFRRRTILKYLGICKVSGHFCCRYTFHHVTEPVSYNRKVFVAS